MGWGIRIAPARRKELIMWKNQYGDEFDTEFDARLDAEEMLDSNDILEWIIDHYPASTILEWMGDKALDSTLECINDYFQENYDFMEDETNEGEWLHVL